MYVYLGVYMHVNICISVWMPVRLHRRSFASACNVLACLRTLPLHLCRFCFATASDEEVAMVMFQQVSGGAA